IIPKSSDLLTVVLQASVGPVMKQRDKLAHWSWAYSPDGRHETRVAVVAPAGAMAEQHQFPGLQAVARITSKRGGDTIVERYFLLSRQWRPPELLRIVRSHWSIENSLHWPLDVLLDEDLARSRKDNAPANLAVLRRLALNVARAHPDSKTSLRGKLKRARWDDAFLLDILRHMR
ncbi:MAG: ISAs1 family transposase, partial [Xanthobacteraceae bacterium]